MVFDGFFGVDGVVGWVEAFLFSVYFLLLSFFLVVSVLALYPELLYFGFLLFVCVPPFSTRFEMCFLS